MSIKNVAYMFPVHIQCSKGSPITDQCSDDKSRNRAKKACAILLLKPFYSCHGVVRITFRIKKINITTEYDD